MRRCRKCPHVWKEFWWGRNLKGHASSWSGSMLLCLGVHVSDELKKEGTIKICNTISRFTCSEFYIIVCDSHYSNESSRQLTSWPSHTRYTTTWCPENQQQQHRRLPLRVIRPSWLKLMNWQTPQVFRHTCLCCLQTDDHKHKQLREAKRKAIVADHEKRVKVTKTKIETLFNDRKTKVYVFTSSPTSSAF